MSMNLPRLKVLLADQRYVLAHVCPSTGDTVFVRKRQDISDLFDRVLITSSKSSSSKLWDWYTAYAELSLVPGWTAVKGICETQVIADLPYAGDRCSSHLKNDAIARTWEIGLLEKIPAESEMLFRKCGRELIEGTVDLRTAVLGYYSKYQRPADPKGYLYDLKHNIEDREAEMVEALPRYGAVTIPDHTLSFQIALSLIFRHMAEVEQSKIPIGSADLSRNKELFLRLQVLASRIAEEAGWK